MTYESLELLSTKIVKLVTSNKILTPLIGFILITTNTLKAY